MIASLYQHWRRQPRAINVQDDGDDAFVQGLGPPVNDDHGGSRIRFGFRCKVAKLTRSFRVLRDSRAKRNWRTIATRGFSEKCRKILPMCCKGNHPLLDANSVAKVWRGSPSADEFAKDVVYAKKSRSVWAPLRFGLPISERSLRGVNSSICPFFHSFISTIISWSIQKLLFKLLLQTLPSFYRPKPQFLFYLPSSFFFHAGCAGIWSRPSSAVRLCRFAGLPFDQPLSRVRIADPSHPVHCTQRLASF